MAGTKVMTEVEEGLVELATDSCPEVAAETGIHRRECVTRAAGPRSEDEVEPPAPRPKGQAPIPLLAKSVPVPDPAVFFPDHVEERTTNLRAQPIIFAVAAGLTVALYAVLWRTTVKGTWLHDFFFARSWIQWATLGVFCFGLVALVERCLMSIREGLALRRLRRPGGLRQAAAETDRPGVVTQRIHRLHTYLIGGKREHAHDYARYLADNDAGELEAGYSTVGDVCQILPLLGFFGTVFGLSIGLYRHFVVEGGSAVSKSFAKAIATAFDTTLLALACTIVVIIVQRLLRKREEGILSALGGVVDRWLSAIRRDPAPGAAPAAEWPAAAVEALEGELKHLCRSVAREARDSLTAACAAATRQLDDEVAQARQTAKSARELASELAARFDTHLKRLATDMAAAAKAEIASAAGSAAEGFRMELAAGAERILQQMASRPPAAAGDAPTASAVEMAEALKPALAAIQERQEAVLARLAGSAQESNERLGQSLAEMSAARREELEAVRALTGAIEQHDGHSATVVATALRENLTALASHVDEIVRRPRRLSLVEEPWTDGEDAHDALRKQ